LDTNLVDRDFPHLDQAVKASFADLGQLRQFPNLQGAAIVFDDFNDAHDGDKYPP